MGSQPSPPTLDTGKSKELTAAELKLKREEIAPTTGAAGDASRLEFSKNLEFALRGFTNPASVVYGAQIADTAKEVAAAQTRVEKLKSAQKSGGGGIFGVATRDQYLDPTRGWRPMSEYQSEIDKAQAEVGRLQTKAADLAKADPVGDLQRAFAPEFAARDRLLKDMEGARGSTAEYTRMQQAYGRGVTTQQADMERMQAQETDQSAIGGRLMGEAMRKMDQGGQLSPEAAREATQAARAGMAARGMATGSAGLGAELLNRDRFARVREFENLGFAQGVEAQDLARRTQNTQFRQQAGMQNAQSFNQLSQFNTGMRADTDRFNMGLLGTSAQMSEAERARQLALGQDAYNFGLSTNPKMMLSGLGSPFANMTQPAMGMIGGVNMQPIYSGGSPGTAGQNMMLAGTLGGGALAAGGMVAGAAII